MLGRDKILCIDLKNKRMNKKKTVLKKKIKYNSLESTWSCMEEELKLSFVSCDHSNKEAILNNKNRKSGVSCCVMLNDQWLEGVWRYKHHY